MTGKIDRLPIQAYVPESEETISIIFKAPFLLILYFLDFRISLLSFVHTICALIMLLYCSYSKRINIIPIKSQRLCTYLSNFLTGQRILIEDVPWKILAIPPIFKSTFALISVWLYVVFKPAIIGNTLESESWQALVLQGFSLGGFWAGHSRSSRLCLWPCAIICSQATFRFFTPPPHVFEH